MPTRFRFDKFTLLTFERMLLSDGQPVALGSRAIEVLRALVERRGAVVSKSELFELAWPGLVVEDNNLAVQVSLLRKVLGPSAIVNVARLGYRFGLPVEELTEEAAADAVGMQAASRDAEWLPVASPPVASLPVPPEFMAGRDADSAALDALLQRHRLVTIVGPSGVGKTALATVAAHARSGSLRDGAVWIDVAAIHQATLVPRVLAQTLRLSAAGNDDALPALAAQLRHLETLIVFDNVEHLPEAVAQLVNALLNGAPGLRMLVTSQTALKLSSERVFRLEPLTVPPGDCSLEEASTHGAVALFVDQAQGHDRRFVLDGGNLANVALLCRQLDGLPLAIKMAVARLPIFGIEGVRARLADRFTLLRAQAPDLPTRHQTLRAALDWSHGLLPPEAQVVFRRLAVFAGGFSLELAAVTVKEDAQDEQSVDDAIELLADHSLLAVDVGEPPRYRLLDSTRAYAQLELESSGESDATHRRHAQAMLALCKSASRDYWNESDADFLSTYGQEIDNVRVALDWCLTHDGPLGLALLGEASDLFNALLLYREWCELHETYERWLSPTLPPEVRARHHLEVGRFHVNVTPDKSREQTLLAAQLYGELGDAKRLYFAVTFCVASTLTPVSTAREMVQALARIEEPQWPPRLLRLRWLAEVYTCFREGRSAQAYDAANAALAYARRAGAVNQTGSDLSNLVVASLMTGNSAQAVRLGRELMAGKYVQMDRNIRLRIIALGNLANALLVEGEIAEAHERIANLFNDCRNNNWELFDNAADVYALLAASEGRFDAAARLIGYSDRAWERLGHREAAEAAARERAWRLVEAALDPALLQGLLAEGSEMDREAVCQTTLSTRKA